MMKPHPLTPEAKASSTWERLEDFVQEQVQGFIHALLEEDQGNPVAMNKLLADNIPGAQLRVVKEVGHFSQLEKPTEFNQELRQFLNQVAA